MRRNRTLRTLPLALAFTAALALGAPAAASPAPAGPAALWQWLAGFVGLDFVTGEEGGGADPNGGRASSHDGAGSIADPNGVTVSADLGEAGNIVAPNG